MQFFMMIDVDGPMFGPTDHDLRTGIMKTMVSWANGTMAAKIAKPPPGVDNVNGSFTNDEGRVIGQWMIK